MTDANPPLGDAASIAAAIAHLASTIDARASGEPSASWTAKLLAAGPHACAKKLGEEGVEAAIAIAAQSDDAVVAEAADVLYHLLVGLRSRGIQLDAVATALTARQGQSGLAEKASRND